MWQRIATTMMLLMGLLACSPSTEPKNTESKHQKAQADSGKTEVPAQQPPEPEPSKKKTASKQLLDKRCRPKVVEYGKSVDKVDFREQSYRNSPVVSFLVQESGEVTNAVLERSSGVTDIDTQVLAWARETRYNSRPGCGVIESKASINIHFR